MFDRNLPMWERLIRICLGIAMGVAAFGFEGSVALKITLGATGAILAITGLAARCPMCAVAGRQSQPPRPDRP